MKSETLYAQILSRYIPLLEDRRYDLSYIAEKELFIPHLSFRQSFGSSTLEVTCLEKEAYE